MKHTPYPSISSSVLPKPKDFLSLHIDSKTGTRRSQGIASQETITDSKQ